MIHAYEKRTKFADMNHIHYRKILKTDSNLSAAIKKKNSALYTNYVVQKYKVFL